MADEPIVVTGLARTPIGSFQGELSGLSAPKLGSLAIEAALKRGGAESVDEVFMGCVLPAGLGQAPARQAALGAGLPQSVGCTTVNKMCGSGMKAAMLGFDAIRAGSARAVVAGGMESMTNAPYLLDKARQGYRMGHGALADHMFLDGLEDAYEPGRLMGSYAEDCAEKYQFTRSDQDAFALTSIARAQQAQEHGAFQAEIVPLEAPAGRNGANMVQHDELPRRARPEKIPNLKPAFRPDGTVTAANSSGISDGAAALVLMGENEADRRGATPLVRIAGHTSHAQEPAWFTTAPIGAMQALFDKLGWAPGDVDLYEINEAFAVVTMAAMRAFDLPHDKVNVHGGACALGHPIGASGARILATLISAMQQRDAKRGVAAICIGGGEATAIGVERA